MTVETLIVEFDANTSKFDKKVKGAKDDIDGLGESAKGADGKLKGLGGAFKAAGGAVKTMGTSIIAAGAALTTMITLSAKSEKELSNLARTAGKSREEFAKTAFVFKQYGVDAKGAADALNDVSERVGEFAATFAKDGKGTGAFQDFADVMRLTDEEAGRLASELQNLSGESIIQHLVNEMEQANVTGAQMSWVMKSLSNDLEYASDAFADNGKKAGELKDRYAALQGAIDITADEAKDLEEASEAFDLMTSSVKMTATAISAELAPAFTKFFSSVTEIVPEATVAIMDFFNAFDDVSEFESLSSIDKQIIKLQERIADLKEDGNIFGWTKEGGLGSEDEVISRLESDLDALIQKRDNLFSSGQEEEFEGGFNDGGRSQQEIDAEREKNQLEALKKLESEKAKITQAAQEEALAIEKERLRIHWEEVAEEFSDIEDPFSDAFGEEGTEPFWLTQLRESLLVEKELLDARREDFLNRIEDEKLSHEDLAKAKHDINVWYSNELKKLEEKRVDSIEDGAKTTMKWGEVLQKSGQQVGNAMFEDNKNVSRGMAIVNTATGVTKALASQDYAGATFIAIQGAIQLAAINSASAKGGGGQSSAPTAPAINTNQQQQEDTGYTAETRVTATGGDSATGNIRFEADGDELTQVLAGLMNKGVESGAIKLGEG